MVSFTFTAIGAAILVFLVVYGWVRLAALQKERIDETQEQISRAGAVAVELGFQKLDDLLFAIGAGNVKKALQVGKELFREYASTPRGPVRLARDVFMATWAKLRNDDEFGDEVRGKVVSEALGISVNDKTDIAISRAAGRVERLGWTKLATAGHAWASRSWREFSDAIRALFNELNEEGGEIAIASRVMEPTFKAVWEDPKTHPQAAALVASYAAQLGWTPPASAGASAAAK